MRRHRNNPGHCIFRVDQFSVRRAPLLLTATRIIPLTSSLQLRLHHNTLSTEALMLPSSYLHFSNRKQFFSEGEGGGGGGGWRDGGGGVATRIIPLTSSLQLRLHHNTLSTGALMLPSSYLHFNNRKQFFSQGEGGWGGEMGGGGGY